MLHCFGAGAIGRIDDLTAHRQVAAIGQRRIEARVDLSAREKLNQARSKIYPMAVSPSRMACPHRRVGSMTLRFLFGGNWSKGRIWHTNNPVCGALLNSRRSLPKAGP